MLKFPWKHNLHFSVNGKMETIFIDGVITISQLQSEIEEKVLCQFVSSSFAFRSLLEGETFPSPDCALVLEDETGVCGYALALSDAKQAAAKVQVTDSTRSSRASRR